MREVTLPEAAGILGLTREGVRRRLLKGRLEGRKSNETGEWTVLLPDELLTTTVANGGPASASVAERCQRLEIEVARLEERLAAADRLLAEREAVILDLRADRDRTATLLRATLDRPGWWERVMRTLRGAGGANSAV
jgi:hypothetical protein